MSDLRLRDHSQPCEHGYFTQCGNWLKNDRPHDAPCPGGREITLRSRINHAQSGHHVCAHYGCETVYVELEEA